MSVSFLYFFSGLSPKKSFITFNVPAICTKGSEVSGPHSLSDTVSQEPSALDADSKGPMKLIRRNALLRRANQIDGGNPYIEGVMRVFKDSSDLDSELFSAH